MGLMARRSGTLRARSRAAGPEEVPGTDVPKAIKNVLGQTITTPQLPLVLFVIVLLELAFGPILRPGGATA